MAKMLHGFSYRYTVNFYLFDLDVTDGINHIRPAEWKECSENLNQNITQHYWQYLLDSTASPNLA